MEPNTSQEEEWKRMQLKTFTRWCNARLAVQQVTVEDLSTDLCDGVKLIVLLEVLSQKRLGKFNKKPRMHAQRMENVEIALQFITQKEKIRLVNIGSGDIVEGNLKLILGLVWTLILHYQISVGLSKTLGASTLASGQKETGSPKENLLNYLERSIQLPGKKIRNVTTDWNDGILIATLVDSVARGLCPECDEMLPENALQNVTHAMTLAEDWLSVPQVLHPADMVNPNVDELSMMTYLSQFLTAKLKPGAPLKPTGNPLLVKVFGLGIQKEGVSITMSSASFTIDTEGAGPGKIGIQCTGPSGPIKVDIVSSGKHTYSCSYVPSVQGTYTMDIYFSRKAVLGSPFKIQVAGGMAIQSPTRRGTLTKVTAATTATPDFKISGPGLNGEPLLVHKTLKYVVEARGAGPGKIACTVHVFGQQIQCAPIVAEVKDGTFSIEFTPTVAGSHEMAVAFGGKPIPKTPIYLKIIDISKVRISGTGLSGGIATKWAEFSIDANAAGEGKLEVSINGPTTVQPTLQSGSDGLTNVKFLPAVPGKYTITIFFGNQTVPGSPFFATFSKPDTGKVYVLSGPGLKRDGIVVNSTAQFSFDPKSAASEFKVTIIGPVTGAVEKHIQSHHAIPTVSKNTNGTYNVSFKPQLVGLYKVHLHLNGQELPESPIEVNVTDPTEVKVIGPGIQEIFDEKPGPVIHIPEALQWTLDCCNAGLGPLQATLQKDDERATDLQITTVGNGFHTIKCKPDHVGQYRLCVKLAGNAIPISPTFILTRKEMPCDVAKVIVYGAGVGGNGNGAQTGSPLPVYIDTRSAGSPGHITAVLTKPHGEISSLQFKPDQKEGVYVGEYTSYETGCHKLSICIDDKPIPNSPFSIPICKPTAVKLSGSGLDQAITNIPNTIDILTDEAGPGIVAVEFEGPSNIRNVEYTVKQKSDHKYELKYNPSVPGTYYLTISYGGFPVGKKLQVQCKSMESYVMEEIDGLERNNANADTSGTTKIKYINVGKKAEIQLAKIPGNKHNVNIDMKGPQDCKISTKESSNATLTVTLIPKTIGTYQLVATQGQMVLNGSPFTIKVVNPTAVKLSGPGVKSSNQQHQTEHLHFTEQLQWVVDFTSAGFTASDFNATVSGEEGYSENLEVTEIDTYHASITFAPAKCGPYILRVLAGGLDIQNSPVNISLQDIGKQESRPNSLIGIMGKPVTVTFGTKQPHKGPVTIEIEGPSSITPTLTSERPGTFLAMFVPTMAGIYKLSAKQSGTLVPGAAFSINVIDPTAVIASGSGVTGKDVAIGKKAEVLVDTQKAGIASIEAMVTRPTGQNIQLKITSLNTSGQFSGEYTPQESGNHKLQISFNGESIPQSPFNINVPSHDECNTVKMEDLHSMPPGFMNMPHILLDASAGEPGTLEAWVKSPNEKQLQCTLSNQGEKCKVSFLPLSTGMHFIHVTRNKQPVQGSPFPVDVKAHQVLNVEGPEVTQLAIGQPVKLQVSEGVEGKGELKVNVDGPADCRVESRQNADDSYTIELTPMVAGTYLVHLTHGNRPVRGSPFVVKVFNPMEVKLSGPGVTENDEDNDQPNLLPLDKQLEWTVDLTSAGLLTSDLSATVHGLEGYSKELEIAEKDAYHASITFAPHRCGPYKLQVVAGGQEVPRSPVSISLQDVSKVTATGPGLTGGRVGKPITVSIDTTQAGEGSLSLEIGGPANVTPTCTSKEPGTFVVNFEPTKAGVYTLNAKYSDKDIPGSPFSIPVVNPAEVTVSGTAVTGKGLGVGKTAEVIVDTTQAGSALVKATVTTPTGKDVPLSLVPVEEDGVLHGKYVPDEAGNHKLHVAFDEEPLPQSPYNILVPSEEECSVMEQEDLQSAPSEFTDLPQLVIDAPVGERGSLEAWVEAPNEKQLQCTLSNQGEKCKVSFLPLSTGMHFIHVTRNKQPVQGSPFPVDVKAHQVLNVEGPEVTQLAIGQPVKLQVSEGVEGKGELKVNVDGPADCRVESRQNADDSYTIELTPMVAGTYLVHLTHGNRPVRGSPFVVKVFNPMEVKLSGPGVTENDEDNDQPNLLPLDKQLEWTVDLTSAGLLTSDLSATVHGLEGYSKELEIAEKDAYHASITFAPHRCGPYKLQVVAGGHEVPRSPVSISLQDVSKVTATGPGLTGGRVGKPITVSIDTTQAGEGSLSLEIGGPANVTPTCTSKEPGTFVVNFEPTKAGVYTLNAKYSDKDIPGSPFSIPVVNPAEVTVSGTAVTGKGLGVGKTAEVIVDTTQAGSALVKATVTTPTGKDVPLSLVPVEEDGVLHGKYVPDETGNHKLHVTFNEEPIPKSPFDMVISCVEKCVMIEQDAIHSAPSFGFDMFNLPQSSCSESFDLPQLLIDCHLCEEEYVQSWVEAPNENRLPCMMSKQGDKLKLSYFPLSTGMHFIHVVSNQMPIQGSPFPFNVTSQHLTCIRKHQSIELIIGETVHLQVAESVLTAEDLKVTVDGPSNCNVEIKQIASSDYTIELTPSTVGIYLVHILYRGHLVDNSPFVLIVAPISEQATRINNDTKAHAIVHCSDSTRDGSKNYCQFEFAVSGPGIEGGELIGQVAFAVKALGECKENVNVDICGPQSCDMMMRNDGDGTTHVQYVPAVPGIYDINIRYAGHHIKGSPYHVCWSRSLPDASKCIVSGIEKLGRFHIDCRSGGGFGYLEVAVFGAFVPAEDITVKHNGDFTFDITYKISQPGLTTISVKWHGIHLCGSPFTVYTV